MATDHIEIEKLTGAFAKHLRIMGEVVWAAQKIAKLFKTLPKGKHGNIFIKSYNRRPRNKQKRAIVIMQSTVQSAMTAAQVATIASQPLPSFFKWCTYEC